MSVSSSSDSDLASGTRIGPYAVGAVLGRGAYGTVLSATHVAREGRFALKVIHDQRRKLLPRLRRERELQWQVRHPNVVRVIEQVQFGRRPVLVLELVDGPNLLGFLRAHPGPMPYDTVDALAVGVIAGVGAAHREGIVHRDLKPENILVGPGLVPKVTDFGLSKALGRPHGMSLTLPMGMLGTPSYMAPEQALDAKTVTHRADVFSLGCILYELVTGLQAFPGSGVFGVLEAIGSGTYLPVARVRPDCPERMVRAIDACLVTDPARRMPDCDLLLRVWTGAVDWRPVDPAAFDERETECVVKIGPPGRSFDSSSSDVDPDGASDKTTVTIVPDRALAPGSRRPGASARSGRPEVGEEPEGGARLGRIAAVGALVGLVLSSLCAAPLTAVLRDRAELATRPGAAALEAPAEAPARPTSVRSPPIEQVAPEATGAADRDRGPSLAPEAPVSSADARTASADPPAASADPPAPSADAPADSADAPAVSADPPAGTEEAPGPRARRSTAEVPPRLNVQMTCGGWAHVYLDGEKLARPAPLNVPVEPGVHEVRIENPLTGLSEARSERFEAGAVVKVQVLGCTR